MRKILFIVIAAVCFSCGDDVLPKPEAFLRLDYPSAKYRAVRITDFSFEKNRLATKIISKRINGKGNSYGITLEYPKLKGSIYLTYKAIGNSRENLVNFLRDAQNFTQEHTKKAQQIKSKEYSYPERNVYGMLYEVTGNAASQTQFYITDSINHFLSGSLYFYARPNYDSILPAAHYLEKDIKHIMETVKWQ